MTNSSLHPANAKVNHKTKIAHCVYRATVNLVSESDTHVVHSLCLQRCTPEHICSCVTQRTKPESGSKTFPVGTYLLHSHCTSRKNNGYAVATEGRGVMSLGARCTKALPVERQLDKIPECYQTKKNLNPTLALTNGWQAASICRLLWRRGVLLNVVH